MLGRPFEGLNDVTAGWMQHAACRGQGPDIFFVDRGAPLHEAHSFCQRCTVRQECLDYAVANGIAHGLWGNTAPMDRRVIRHDITSRDAGRRMKWLADHGWRIGEIAREFGVGERVVNRALAKERAA